MQSQINDFDDCPACIVCNLATECQHISFVAVPSLGLLERLASQLHALYNRLCHISQIFSPANVCSLY